MIGPMHPVPLPRAERWRGLGVPRCSGSTIRKMRKSKTIHRIARSLDIPDRRIHVSHTVPRPEGWTESTADMGRWATMIRTRK